MKNSVLGSNSKYIYDVRRLAIDNNFFNNLARSDNIPKTAGYGKLNFKLYMLQISCVSIVYFTLVFTINQLTYSVPRNFLYYYPNRLDRRHILVICQVYPNFYSNNN